MLQSKSCRIGNLIKYLLKSYQILINLLGNDFRKTHYLCIFYLNYQYVSLTIKIQALSPAKIVKDKFLWMNSWNFPKDLQHKYAVNLYEILQLRLLAPVLFSIAWGRQQDGHYHHPEARSTDDNKGFSYCCNNNRENKACIIVHFVLQKANMLTLMVLVL